MKKFIVANWKMQLSILETKKLIKDYKSLASKNKNIFNSLEIVACPDFLMLDTAVQNFKKNKLSIGAQNCAVSDSGSWTGEVSPLNLKKLGVNYVILGHSERRQKLNESDSLINEKIKIALSNKLIPIVCIGETLEQRKAGKTKIILLNQLKQVFKNLQINKSTDLILAYEPVWAIGNGKTPTISEINDVHKFLHTQIKKILKIPVLIIYGGSVNQNNAAKIIQEKYVDGLLVGGASLQAKNFFDLIKNNNFK